MHPRGTIRSKTTSYAQHYILTEHYAEMLFYVARASLFGKAFTNADIERTLAYPQRPSESQSNTVKPKRPRTRAETWKRQIQVMFKKSGVDHERLLEIERGVGVRLAEGVEIQGPALRDVVRPEYAVLLPPDRDTKACVVTIVNEDGRSRKRELMEIDSGFVLELERARREAPLSSEVVLRVFNRATQDVMVSEMEKAAIEQVDAFKQRLLCHPCAVDPERIVVVDPAGWRLADGIEVRKRRVSRQRASGGATRSEGRIYNDYFANMTKNREPQPDDNATDNEIRELLGLCDPDADDIMGVAKWLNDRGWLKRSFFYDSTIMNHVAEIARDLSLSQDETKALLAHVVEKLKAGSQPGST